MAKTAQKTENAAAVLKVFAVLESLARGLGVEDQAQAANGSAPVQLPLGKGSNIKPINLNGKIS